MSKTEKEHCLFVARVLHDTLAYNTKVCAAWFHETASKDPCQVCADIAAVIETETGSLSSKFSILW